jgi:tetratricopeptide (TPR) repeat protein
MKLGRYTLALSDAEKALAVNRMLDRNDQVAISLNNLGTVQERLGDLKEAEASYEEAVALSRKTGEERVLAIALNNLAGMIIASDAAKAETLAGEAGRIGKKGSWPGIRARAAHNRARAALKRGAVDESRALCDEALALAANANERGTRAACLVTLGRIEASSGDNAAAVRLVEEALAIDRDLEDPYAIALDYTRLAEIQRMSGDEAGAEASLEKAGEIFKILGIGKEPDTETR